MTEKRYLYYQNIIIIIQRKIDSDKLEAREQDKTDYIGMFSDMFDRELILRNSSYASEEHLMLLSYTLFCYDKNMELTVVGRISDIRDLILVTNDSEIQEDAVYRFNYYNVNSGRVVINSLKTQNNVSYDFITNKIVKSAFKVSYDQNPRKYLFPNNYQEKKHFLKVGEVLGYGNREVRKMYENIYAKIMKYDSVKLSIVLAHEVNTGFIAYQNSVEYTEVDRLKNKAQLDKLLVTSSMVPKNK